MENILSSLIGGVLIGTSTLTMLGGIGRITGISGIVAGSMTKPQKDNLWRLSFLFGLIAGGVVMLFFRPDMFFYHLHAPVWKAIFAGILVGYGTRLGSGCTSGHGVCGLARMAKRSFIATITFIGFGMITVLIWRVL